MSSRRERQTLAQRKYRAAHLEEDRARSRAYHHAHREAQLAKQRAYWRTVNWTSATWWRRRQGQLKARKEAIQEQLAALAKEEQACQTYLESATRKKSSGPAES